MTSSLVRSALAAASLLVVASCESTVTLPAEYVGRWVYTGTTGGFAGASFGERDGSAIVITADNTMEHFGPEGILLATERFQVTRGATIFGPEGWILDGVGMVPRVITVNEGVLTLADNVFDGFSSSYERRQP